MDIQGLLHQHFVYDDACMLLLGVAYISSPDMNNDENIYSSLPLEVSACLMGVFTTRYR